MSCIFLFFLFCFFEKNAVMKSNGAKSISRVYLRRVRKAMWTHRALPNPGPSSFLCLCLCLCLYLCLLTESKEGDVNSQGSSKPWSVFITSLQGVAAQKFQLSEGRLFQNLFFFEKLCISWKIHTNTNTIYIILIVFVSMLIFCALWKLKIPFGKKTNCLPKWLADSPARGGFVKWLVSLIL